MTRNVFEDNEEPVVVDGEKLAGKVEAVLPRLSEGYEYVIESLPEGRKAVTVVESNKQTCTCGPGENCSMCPRDKFGRRYAK